jgi:hypothetical protein
MRLGELIATLEKADPDMIVPVGFDNPHSYRGYYEQLAFEPAENVSVASMLAAAREALGSTYQGYKGGDYVMDEYSIVNIAWYGESGEEISAILMSYMLGYPSMPERY